MISKLGRISISSLLLIVNQKLIVFISVFRSAAQTNNNERDGGLSDASASTSTTASSGDNKNQQTSASNQQSSAANQQTSASNQQNRATLDVEMADDASTPDIFDDIELDDSTAVTAASTSTSNLVPPKSKIQFVILDTETTGKYKRDVVVEVACMDVKSGIIRSQLINPMRSIPSEATELHGITNNMVKNAPTMAAYSKSLRSFCNGDKVYVIAHNSPFDEGKLRKSGFAVPENWTFCDSRGIFSKLIGGRFNRSLKTIASDLLTKEEAAQKHRAASDVTMLLRCLQKVMIQKKEENLYNFLMKIIVTKENGTDHKNK